MPESTDDKHEELIFSFVFKVVSLINASIEPLLNMYVPVIDFLSHMYTCFNNYYIDWVDTTEVSSTVTYSWRVHSTHAQFPAEVVLESG